MVRNRKWNRKTHLNMKFFVLFFKYNFEGFQDIITTRPQPTQVSFSASGHLLFYEPKHCNIWTITLILSLYYDQPDFECKHEVFPASPHKCTRRAVTALPGRTDGHADRETGEGKWSKICTFPQSDHHSYRGWISDSSSRLTHSLA